MEIGHRCRSDHSASAACLLLALSIIAVVSGLESHTTASASPLTTWSSSNTENVLFPVQTECFTPDRQSAQMYEYGAQEFDAETAINDGKCLAICKYMRATSGKSADSYTEPCTTTSCRGMKLPEVETQPLSDLQLSICPNGRVRWKAVDGEHEADVMVYVLGIFAVDSQWSSFQVLHRNKSHANLHNVFHASVPNTPEFQDGCYRLSLIGVSPFQTTRRSNVEDHFSPRYLGLTTGGGQGELSKCGGDLSFLGTSAGAGDTSQSSLRDGSFTVSLDHFKLLLSNTSLMQAVIYINGSGLGSVDVTCRHSEGVARLTGIQECHKPEFEMHSDFTSITIPHVLTARDYFVHLKLTSQLINFTASINFTSPDLKPNNFVVQKLKEDEIRAVWTFSVDQRLRISMKEESQLYMKVFWRKLPSRLQSTEVNVAKRQANGSQDIHHDDITNGYMYTSVPLSQASNGRYSAHIRDLVSGQKYSVRVMGLTALSQTSGVMTDFITYDPALFLMESEDEEGISWAEKPLAIILFSVCGALIIVILIICCFLAVNRRRVEKKRERRAAKEKQRRHYLLPTACLGLNNGCYPKPSSAWPPNADHAAHADSEQNSPVKSGQEVKTTWVYVDKTPRDTPDLLSIVDESESYVKVRQMTPSTRTPTPNGTRSGVRNLRTTGKATTIFRPLCKSTEHLDVPDFTQSAGKQGTCKEGQSSSKNHEDTGHADQHRSRFNTMSNPIRQSMRKKKAKVMAELQQLGRGGGSTSKPSSLKHRMKENEVHDSLNTERLTALAKDELRYEGFKVPASPFSSGTSSPVMKPGDTAMADEWEIPFEQLYLQDVLLDCDVAVTMKAELVGTESVDENGMPLPKTPDHSSSNGNAPSKSGGSNSLSADSSPSSGVIRTNSLRKATLTKSKQPVVRSTSVHSTSLTRKLVTVKILKDDISEEDQRDFCREIGLMKRIGQHRHLLSLLGCCTVARPVCIVIEHAAYGDLLTYLRSKRPKKSSTMSLQSNTDSGISSDTRASVRSRCSTIASHGGQSQVTATELMEFMRQTNQAMMYLSNKGIVHRNLSAKTILLAEGHQIKLADFGLNSLSPRIDSSKGDQIKWMAIEALFDKKFTLQNDVWAFGVVLWEICTLGEFPYNTIANTQLLDTLQGGYRMRKPESCSDKLYMVMLHCWSRRPTSRPTFTDLEKTLSSLLSKSGADDHIDIEALSKSVNVPLRKRPSSVSQVPPLAIESSRSSVRITHSQPTTPRTGETVSFTWLNPSDSDDTDSDDNNLTDNHHGSSSAVSVFNRSLGSNTAVSHRSGSASNRSSVHFADEKLPRLIQANSKEEVMRARSGSWNSTGPAGAVAAIERQKQKTRQPPSSEKVTIFDQHSSKSLTLQPSSYYINEMKKYRQSGHMPVDPARFTLSPDVIAMVNGHRSNSPQSPGEVVMTTSTTMPYRHSNSFAQHTSDHNIYGHHPSEHAHHYHGDDDDDDVPVDTRYLSRSYSNGKHTHLM